MPSSAGSTVVAREVARLYPEVPFVATFWDESEVTLHRPAPNLFRFSADFAQQTAGLGAYAFEELGWRRATVLTGDQHGRLERPLRRSPPSSARSEELSKPCTDRGCSPIPALPPARSARARTALRCS